MKQRYAFLLTSALSFGAVTAQNLVTLNYGNNVVNGQTLAIVGASTTYELDAALTVTLNGSTDRTLKVKRYELLPVVGTSNTFCWGVCYLPNDGGARPIWVSDLSENLQAGVAFNGFHAYYYPTATEDITKFRFVWYDETLPTDSAYVDIVFDTRSSAVGVNEVVADAGSVEVFPNPVVGDGMSIRFGGAAASNGRWMLHNALGTLVREGTLRATQGDVFVSTAGLGGGLYFASLYSNGRVVATKRVVIAR